MAPKDFKAFEEQLARYTVVAYHAQNGDYNNAIRYSNALLKMGFATDAVYSIRGLARRNKGNYDDALNDCNQALEVARHSKVDLASPLLHRAQCYLQMGNLDATIQDCDRAIEIVNQRLSGSEGDEKMLVDAYMDRGLAQSAKGDHSQALADCEQAFAHVKTLKPRSQSLLHTARGSVLGVQGRYDAAMADFDNALRLAESRPYATAWAYWQRGLVRGKQGDPSGAISDFTAAIAVCPQLVDPYRSRADQYKAMGDSKRASADYQMVADLRSDPPDAIYPEQITREVRALIRRPINKNMAAVALILGVITLALLALIMSQLR